MIMSQCSEEIDKIFRSTRMAVLCCLPGSSSGCRGPSIPVPRLNITPRVRFQQSNLQQHHEAGNLLISWVTLRGSTFWHLYDCTINSPGFCLQRCSGVPWNPKSSPIFFSFFLRMWIGCSVSDILHGMGTWNPVRTSNTNKQNTNPAVPSWHPGHDPAEKDVLAFCFVREISVQWTKQSRVVYMI